MIEKEVPGTEVDDENAGLLQRVEEENRRKLDLAEREKTLTAREKRMATESEAFLKEVEEIEKTKSALSQREMKLRMAEIRRDEGFQDKYRQMETEIAEKRAALDADLAKLREKRLSELDAEIERLRKVRFAEIEKQCAEEHSFRLTADEAARKEFESYKAAKIQELQEMKTELDGKKQELSDKKQKLSAKEDDLVFEERRYKDRANKLSQKEEACEEYVQRQIAEREKSFAADIAAKERECERLRGELRSQRELHSRYEELERKLGGEDPAKKLQELTIREEKLKDREKELLEYAKQQQTEILKEFDNQNKEKKRLEEACTHLSEENRDLKVRQQDARDYEAKIDELYTKCTSLTNQKLALETEVGRMEQDLKRFNALYKHDDDKHARVSAIETPYFKDPKRRRKGEITEMDWLDGIHNSCAGYGFVFPRRLLYAFHTALKIAEWSSITVLAGVSGTGKSKLPELYAHFGGLNFLSLAVQPNWDSKESMLGFFNTIEGKYDAQPVLQFLAQTQKDPADGCPGFKDALNIVLLDEMNLANVELYFAEFLSKLEERSGKAEGQEPDIRVKLGSGMDDYSLKLGRNVLWVGTMNQDETTKSLSDKVLDRGIVINFPRPTKLTSREMKPFADPADLLPKVRWENWKATKDDFEANAGQQLNGYRTFVEEVNASLAKVGLAIGYRVWQSIEQYMINYPRVRDENTKIMEAAKRNDDAAKTTAQNRLKTALRDAFEDQLAQKVMPKLRGIETTGDQRKQCLDPIKERLKSEDYEKLVVDFDNAMKFGNGQFIWNSSDYLHSLDEQSNG